MGITGWIAGKVQQWVCEGLVSGMQGSEQQQQNSSGNKNRHTYSLSPVANGHSKDTQSYLVAAFKQLPRHSHPLPSPVSYFARVPGKSATKLLLVCVWTVATTEITTTVATGSMQMSGSNVRGKQGEGVRFVALQ